MNPLSTLFNLKKILPDILQSEHSEKKSKTSQQVQVVNNVPSQTEPNAQISFLKNKRTEMIDLKNDLIKVKNQSRKGFLSYSKKEDCFVLNGSLSFPQKMAIKLGLSDGGYSIAPFNPESHNIISPGQRVKVEDIVKRLEKSQLKILAEITLNEMLNSESGSDDIGPPPSFRPEPPPNNLDTVKQENQSPEARPPAKPPRIHKYEKSQSAPVQNTPSEKLPTILEEPDSSPTSADREFDELFNSEPIPSTDVIEKEFNEMFGDKQITPNSQDTSLSSFANPGRSETEKTAVPTRPPRKRDALNDQKKKPEPL
ncbi:hypothetical protein PF66_03603 [Pseudomonas asplenii]|uniref:Uncharacterized protein n=1 Tax=Pseudomonas asplenii TaxID=53407 RepID=A0A0M9GFM5_9PSED|nr:hypothetical protein [Pseudomonas fuscovaginae]KPA89750.1 hypothetical protein PF66_03603 [Pseudomonas fuscovaginae]